MAGTTPGRGRFAGILTRRDGGQRPPVLCVECGFHPACRSRQGASDADHRVLRQAAGPTPRDPGRRAVLGLHHAAGQCPGRQRRRPGLGDPAGHGAECRLPRLLQRRCRRPGELPRAVADRVLRESDAALPGGLLPARQQFRDRGYRADVDRLPRGDGRRPDAAGVGRLPERPALRHVVRCRGRGAAGGIDGGGGSRRRGRCAVAHAAWPACAGGRGLQHGRLWCRAPWG